ncbi:S phase cyclin A-associated protein in the endoplasmic reticulum [Condylostylus longicornis]|uniref:S phase cyclin A-associated protein in the endoplasmic reticulum n=1 Tax=Condylostylus longicornis TaxID=2530218 RepID=UPI00244DA722|nr:S phase cyclin A-associated protein in the endoplasmic reticulum [Condylostylus longicornis]
MSFLSKSSESSIAKKPPVFPKVRPNLYPGKSKNDSNSKGSNRRVRSASTGRDKKSEIQARYWAFLFGNLQRAINEIYETVECYENMSSCQETILVLENYIRDFKALAEWFRVSWDYESTPLPQRPNSLAWEIRKSNPVPRVHKSFSSPLTSGKSSPNFSGKSSPSSAVEDSKPSPKKFYCYESTSKNSTVGKLNIKELFSNKGITKEIVREQNEIQYESNRNLEDAESPKEQLNYEFGCENKDLSVQVVENELCNKFDKCDNSTQTDLEDENLTLAEIREKLQSMNKEINHNQNKSPILPRSINMDLKNKIAETQEKTENTNKIEKKSENVTTKTIENKQIEKNLKKQISPVKYSTILNKNISSKPAAKSVSLRNKNFVRSTCSLDTQHVQPVNDSIPNANKANNKTILNKINFSTSNSIKNCQIPINVAQKKISPQHNSNLYKTDRWKSSTNDRIPLRSKTMIDIKDSKKQNVPKNSISFGRLSRNSSRSINNSTELKNECNLKSTNSFENCNANVSNSNQKQQSQNDGWLTVKTKRKSSSHWVQRFNQPTGYASLPALPLLDEKDESERKKDENRTEENDSIFKKETKSVGKTKPNIASSRNSNRQITKLTARDNKTNNINNGLKTRQTLIKRQKSDLTGLKITSLHKEYIESKKLIEKSKSPQRSVESNENKEEKIQDEILISDEIDPNKIDIKIQTNREFSKAIGDLYDSLSVGPNFNRNDVTLSSCDEYEERDDMESDEDQRKLLEEQELLEKQILELQNTEIDVDTETDETDCEVMIDLDDCNEKTLTNDLSHDSFTVPEEDMTLEMRYYPLFSEMSNCERKETLATLQAYVSRYPGRAQELHQKLSSPSRRRSLQETLKKYQAKQARAKEKRELLQKEKALKIQHLLARVEDVKAAKLQLIEKKRLRMEERLKKATQNRNQYLRDIVRKAHDEEEKLKEIAFIKNLEAQNKRLDFLEACKEHEVRLQDLEQERQKKVEEKAAKEAAVERRRQEIEKARQRRLEKMNESRIEREQRIGKMQEQREKQRLQIAREKAKDREERLLALQAQQQQTTEELQKKIIQKQMESARRHEENIEHIRQRALELSIPSRNVEECSTPISSTKSLEDCKPEDGELSSTLSDVSRENSKNQKKKLKKLKQRMGQKAEEYLKQLAPVPIHIKRESQVPKFLNLVNKGGGPLGMERQFNQLLRIIGKGQVNDFQCFWLLDGLGTVASFLTKAIENADELNTRTTILSVQLYRNACSSCPQIARHSLMGNTITVLFDALTKSCQLPEIKSARIAVPLSVELMLACTVALSPSGTKKHIPIVIERIPDLINYAIMTGLIGILSRRCSDIQDSVESQQSAVLSLLATIGLLTKFTEICPQDPSDPTRFLSSIKSTDLFGVITTLYSNVVLVGETIPPRIISLAAAAFNLLISVAVLDINTFQSVLTAESLISMKYLDVVSMLLKYCGPKCLGFDNNECQAMLVDLIASLGFFCANNDKNQNLLITNPHCVILKNLRNLPEKFNVVIYPCIVTIIDCNEGARKIVSTHFELNLFDEYRKSEKAKKNHLIALLKEH